MVGPIWPGLARDPFALCWASQNPDRQLGCNEDVPYHSGRWCSDASPRMAQQQVGERHWCTIPHTSLSSTGVVKSVDDLTSADLCTISLFVTYVYTNLILLWWTHETVPATVFRDLPDSRYPMKLNHAVSTNSLSHSKIKPLCKLIFCFHYVERHYTSKANW